LDTPDEDNATANPSPKANPFHVKDAVRVDAVQVRLPIGDLNPDADPDCTPTNEKPISSAFRFVVIVCAVI
jgi:hypothetical protein